MQYSSYICRTNVKEKSNVQKYILEIKMFLVTNERTVFYKFTE